MYTEKSAMGEQSASVKPNASEVAAKLKELISTANRAQHATDQTAAAQKQAQQQQLSQAQCMGMG